MTSSIRVLSFYSQFQFKTGKWRILEPCMSFELCAVLLRSHVALHPAWDVFLSLPSMSVLFMLPSCLSLSGCIYYRMRPGGWQSVFMESLFSLVMVPKHKNVDFVANAGTPQTSHKASFWWGGKQTEKLFRERKQPHPHSFLTVCHHNLHGCCSLSLHMIQTWVFVKGVHWRPSAGFGALRGLRLFLSLWTHGYG